MSLSDPSLDLKYFAAAALPLDCVAEDGRAAHAVRVYGDGNLTVVTPAGSRTFAVYDRELVPGKFLAITAFSGTGLRVHWPDAGA